MVTFTWNRVMIVSAIAVAVIAAIVLPYRQALLNAPSVHIIGEVDVNINPTLLAEQYIDEFEYLISDASATWMKEPELQKYSLHVESATVTGDLARAEMPMQRARWTMHNCSAEGLFDFLISPEGFRVIDPVRALP